MGSRFDTVRQGLARLVGPLFGFGTRRLMRGVGLALPVGLAVSLAFGLAVSLGANPLPANADAAAVPACTDTTLMLRGPEGGTARFTIDLATTEAERNKGLMFVDKMATSKGMLFVYDRPQPVAFWMKNTLIPLDMIFADAQGVVQNVHANAIPGEGMIQYVLEINGGLAAMLNIGPGTQIRHPAIIDAAWSCE